MKQYILDNLDCAHCASKIEEGLKNLECVKDAKIVFVTKTLHIDTSDIHQVKNTIKALDPNITLNEKSNNERKKFLLKNLDCAHCASVIEDKLKKQDFILDVNIIFPTKTLIISTNNMAEVKNIIKSIEPKVEIEEIMSNTKEDNTFSVKFEIISLFSLVCLFLFSMYLTHSFENKLIIAIGYIVLISVYLTAGKNVILTSIRNLMKGRIFDENFLMTFATLAAFTIHRYDEAVGVMLFYRAGEFFQNLAVNKSRRSIKSLMDIRPDYANVIRNGREETVSPADILVGETIVIKAGEKIALDGVVTKGKTTVDSRALTGESIPKGVSVSEHVMAGMINLTGIIEVKVEKVFAESSASKILDLVENAAANKAQMETFITKFAHYYTPFVFFTAFLIAVVPPALNMGSFNDWLYRALVALVVSCPCALIISVPLGYFGGIGGASRQGILIKGANYLEALANISAIAFDKTGTLTKGVFKVQKIKSYSDYSEDDILLYASICESKSSHPIAKSIYEAAGSKNYDIDDYEEISGCGIKVSYQGKNIMVGNDRILHNFNIIHSDEVCKIMGSVAHVVIDNVYAGYIIISDELKDDTMSAIQKLKSIGVSSMAVLTGDNKYATESILKDTKLTDYYYDLLPEDKAVKFKEFQDKNKGKGYSIFVGDGINDAPVLAMADVGVSMGGAGSDAAIETADMVIMNDSLTKIYDAVKIAKKTRVIIWQNIIFALVIKAMFIILGLYGIASMWEAVFGDMGVALLTLFNSMRALR